MSMNLFMDFSFVALNNGKFRKERLTEYLALLKNRILKKKNYYLRSVFFFHYTVSVPQMYLHLTFVSLYSLC